MVQKLKNIGHLIIAIAANIYYGFPSRRLYVIGVTGTDGKTTTTSLIHHILTKSGKKSAMITSVGAMIGSKLYDIGFHVTTPSPFAVQQYLKKAADEGNEYVVLETTSHALDQHRSWGVKYRIGILTNITHEHLDYHGTYEAYVNAKLKLLQRAEVAIVNMDDGSYERVYERLGGKQVIRYSLTNDGAEITSANVPHRTPLVGDFNTRNTLAAVAAALHIGIPKEIIKKALPSFRPPAGRQEIVYDKDFRVMVDFAHTPNSFDQILPALKGITTGRLIHIFGSAGLRDNTKRPKMGEASAAHADIIVLTVEDPRVEFVGDICEAIASGIPKRFVHIPLDTTLHPTNRERTFDSNELSAIHDTVDKALKQKKKIVVTIPDRVQAIAFGIGIARKGDTVAVTGKSHETSMNYGDGEDPWDEFAAVRAALKKRKLPVSRSKQ